MGYDSWTVNCNLQIKQGMREAFLKWIEELWKTAEDYAEVIIVDPITDEVQIHIESWKLIGYWRNFTLDYFDSLSKYIEGYMEIECELEDTRAIIEFIDNETLYMLGKERYVGTIYRIKKMQYHEANSKEIKEIKKMEEEKYHDSKEIKEIKKMEEDTNYKT